MEESQESIRTILLKWVSRWGNQWGTIPPGESRMAALGNLFTTFRELGFKEEDVRQYERQIKATCYPGKNYRGPREKKESWIRMVDKDYDNALTSYLIPDEVLSSKIEPLPEIALPEYLDADMPFVAAGKFKINLNSFGDKETGSAKYDPDPEICEKFKIPDGHLE